MPARPSADPTQGPPQLSDLVELLGDPALVEGVVATYLDVLPERLTAIEAARVAPDDESVRAAHSLRSAAALLGLAGLTEACGALEVALRAEPGRAVPELVDVVLELARSTGELLRTRPPAPSRA